MHDKNFDDYLTGLNTGASFSAWGELGRQHRQAQSWSSSPAFQPDAPKAPDNTLQREMRPPKKLPDGSYATVFYQIPDHAVESALDGNGFLAPTWCDPDEAQRRWAFHLKYVMPQRAEMGYVKSGLKRNGVPGPDIRRIETRKYYARYRKWRKRGYPNSRHVQADFERIEAATGWMAGSDHWFMRLLGKGPRLERKAQSRWENSYALSLHREGRFGEAIYAHSEAIRLFGSDAGYRFDRARTYFGQKDYSSVHADIAFVLKLFPNNVQALTLHGATLVHLEKPEEAIVALTRALAIEPEDRLTLRWLASALEDAGRTKEAIEACGQILKVTPDYLFMYWKRGWLYLDDGQLEQALPDFIMSSPEQPYAFKMAGDVCLKLRRNEEALNYLNKAVDAFKNDAVMLGQRGCANLNLKRYEDALKDFSECVAIDPLDPEQHYFLGLTHVRLDDLESAKQSFRKALEIDDGYEKARQWLEKLA